MTRSAYGAFGTIRGLFIIVKVGARSPRPHIVGVFSDSLVNLDPTIGAEIRKTRPVVVISSDSVGALPIRLVAPLTEWKEYFNQNVWHVKLVPDRINGLTKTSAVDTLQLRGVDKQRFVHKIGKVSPSIMKSIAAAIAAVIEY